MKIKSIYNYNMDKLNLKKLHSANKKIANSRKKTYEQVKKECYNKINIISKTNKLFCWYLIPKIIIGFPPIDIEECAEYLKSKLDQEPIIYNFFKPNLFFITWDLNVSKND